MAEIIRREFIYLWYYFDLQLHQIFWYWVLGMLIGSAVSVFLKDRIHHAVRMLGKHRIGILGIVVSGVLGIASPLCMYGTIPLLQQWLWEGISIGSAVSFMLTGPATKITNLGALRIVLGEKRFCLYLFYVMAYSFFMGNIVNVVLA